MGAESKIRRAVRRTLLPYGCWTCADDREVLFNRGYRPLLQRLPGAEVTAAVHGAWVPWKTETWFYSDGDSAVSKVTAATTAWAEFVGRAFDWDAAEAAVKQHGDPERDYACELRPALAAYFAASADQ